MARPIINTRAFLDRRLRAIDEYVRAHISDARRLSLDAAARIVNVTPQHLSRLFHERVGATFTEWQCAVRTEHAKYLIVEQSLQLDTVSRAVGYERYETFSRAFKRCEGVLPSDLRPFLTKYPELAFALRVCTVEHVFRIGPLAARYREARVLLQDIVDRLSA